MKMEIFFDKFWLEENLIRIGEKRKRRFYKNTL